MHMPRLKMVISNKMNDAIGISHILWKIQMMLAIDKYPEK